MYGEIVILAQPSVKTIKRNTRILKEIKVVEKALRLGMLTQEEAAPMLEKLSAKLSTKMDEVYP